MFKLKAGALVVACIFSLSILSGCKSVAEDVEAFAHVYTPRGVGLQISDDLSSLASSSSESSSDSSSEPEPPAPAPVQPITKPVLEDEKFKPTPEDVKEDPQKNQNAGGENNMGEGGTLVVPDAPSNDSSSSSNSSVPAPEPPQNGWYTLDGKKYCYSGGKKLTGWQNINNVGYYFNENGVLSSKMGIDVSKWNGKIDWKKVKEDGIEFAIIRVGVRGCVTGKIVYDEYFEENVKGATANGIQVGVYFFSQAINAEEGRQEAEWTLNAIRGYKITGPIVIDSEYVGWNPAAGDTEPRGNRITRAARTDSLVAFCDTVRASGRTPMIYASRSWFQNQLDLSRLTNVEKWLAYWTTTATWSQPFSMWQCCSDGTVNGISGRVDRNVWKVYTPVQPDDSSSGSSSSAPDSSSSGSSSSSVPDSSVSSSSSAPAPSSPSSPAPNSSPSSAPASNPQASDPSKSGSLSAEPSNSPQKDPGGSE